MYKDRQGQEHLFLWKGILKLYGGFTEHGCQKIIFKLCNGTAFLQINSHDPLYLILILDRQIQRQGIRQRMCRGTCPVSVGRRPLGHPLFPGTEANRKFFF